MSEVEARQPVLLGNAEGGGKHAQRGGDEAAQERAAGDRRHRGEREHRDRHALGKVELDGKGRHHRREQHQEDAANHGAEERRHQEMSGVLAAPRLKQNFSAQFGQSKRVIELAVGKKATIG